MAPQEAKLTNHHLLPSNRHQEEQKGHVADGRKHSSPGQGYVTCSECRKSLIWTDRHSVPLGHIYLHVFLKLLPICFFESLVGPQACWLQWSVRLILYTVAFQIHMIVFLSCVSKIEVKVIYIQNAFHDNISLQPSHVLWNSSVKDYFFCYFLCQKNLKWPQDPFFPLHNFLLPWLQQLGLLLNWLPLRTFTASTVKKVY